MQKKDEGWGPGEEKHYLSNITQEHGIMAQCGDLIRKVNIGDNLLFLPVHSCLTANLMRIYHTLEGGVIKSMNC